MIPVEVTQQVSIQLSLADTFAYVSNVEHLADWSNIVVKTRITSSEAMQVGTTVCSTVRFSGKYSEINFEVVEYEPERYITYKSTSGVTPCLICYRFEPGYGGGTTISQEVVLYLTESMSELGVPVFKNALKRQLACDLLMLKDLLEAKPSSCKLAN